nr:MAG TPA: SWIM zinc finger protein [Caudoviricetes sp.]
MAVSPSSPSVPVPAVRWAFCCCPWGSPPCAHLAPAVK